MITVDRKEIIEEILGRGHITRLGVRDANGGIWLAYVHYTYDSKSLDIYWISDPDAPHSKAMVKDTRVGGTITVRDRNKESDLIVEFSGVANKIEGNRFDLSSEHSRKRDPVAPKEVYEVLSGDSWCMIKVDQIYLVEG